ncbi:MAG: cytochrome C552 [Azonexus sp.]
MHFTGYKGLLGVLAFALLSSSALAADEIRSDPRMIKLATESGCLTCHAVDSGKASPSGDKPIGPAWVDVAKQYRGKPAASQFLTRVVLEGSNPYNSHWKGKVSGIAMPPNAVAITEANTRLLVSWILAL